MVKNHIIHEDVALPFLKILLIILKNPVDICIPYHIEASRSHFLKLGEAA